MKILEITPYYLPHTGGIERYVYNLSKYLISSGHTIDVVTANIPEGLSLEHCEGITVYRHPCICTLMGNPILSGLSKTFSHINDYDIIHIHGVYTYSALRTILAIPRKYTGKIILTHHGRVVYPGSIKNIFAKIYENIVVRYLLKMIDSAVVLSQSDKEQFSSLGMPAEKIVIIPNGIDTVAFASPSYDEQESFCQKYFLQGKHIVLYLAVISERKGIFDLIRAFSKVDDISAHLLVVGDGVDREAAIDLVLNLGISDRVTFTGKLVFSELRCAYSVASVYVLPSYFEGMPTTILEALIMETPVIATSIPGVIDYFSEYVSLVEPGNTEQLKAEIVKVLRNPPNTIERKKISNMVRTEFDASKVFEKYKSIFSRGEEMGQHYTGYSETKNTHKNTDKKKRRK